MVLLSLCCGGGTVGLIDGGEGVVFIYEGKGVAHCGPITPLDYMGRLV